MNAGPYLPAVVQLGLEGEIPPEDFSFDGCTLAPDDWSGEDMRPACLLHDWNGERAKDEADWHLNDAQLYRNLLRCAKAGDVDRDLAHKLAGIYYRRVRVWGFSEQRRLSWLQKAALIVSRYLTPRGIEW